MKTGVKEDEIALSGEAHGPIWIEEEQAYVSVWAKSQRQIVSIELTN